MQKWKVYDLISFVITENCSYQCLHCLKGDRRPNTLSKEVIDTVLSQIKINGIVHLGGGEPLLQMKKVAELLNEIYNRPGNNPKEISVITNGSVGVKKFEEFISIIEYIGVNLNLIISNDYYHMLERKRLNNGKDNIITVVKNYQEIIQKHKIKIKKTRDDDDDFWLLEEYKSYKNGMGVSAIGKGKNIKGATTIKRDFKLDNSVYLKGHRIIGDFQVQVDGRITKATDMSWEERDTYYGKEHNILYRPLQKILKR